MTRREALGSEITTACRVDFHKGSSVIPRSQRQLPLPQLQATVSLSLSWTIVVASCLDPLASVSS